jgi:glycosyltransferase involved in cell wall biosynthesis
MERDDTTPLVDVGIPTRGGRRYLTEAIESVLSQTLDRWRLVVSENGTGDPEVAEMLDPYLRDPRVRHITTGKEVSAARNSTNAISAGDARYVAVLHDDDRWEPEFLARRVDFLEANPGCGFVFSGHIEVDEQGEELRRFPFVLPHGIHAPDKFVPFLLAPNGRPVAPGGTIAAPTVLARRTAYEAMGPAFDERFPGFFDWEMWLRLAVRFPVGYLEVQDAHYRIHREQLNRRTPHYGEQKLVLWEHVEALISRELPALRLGESEWSRRRAGALLSAALDAVEQGDRRHALAHLTEAIRVRPRSLADPRAATVVAALPLGARALHAVTRARRIVRRRYHRLP